MAVLPGLDQYRDVVLSGIESGEERAAFDLSAVRAVDTVIYGPLVDDVLGKSSVLLRDVGELVPGVPVTPDLVAAGVNVLCNAMVRTEDHLKGPRRLMPASWIMPSHSLTSEELGELGPDVSEGRKSLNLLESPVFLRRIEQMRTDVARGVIRLLPYQFAIGGEDQVRYADGEFGRLHGSPRTRFAQWLMAKLNYDVFTGQTMATGKDLFAQPGMESLAQWINLSSHEKMPHLTCSNMVIALMVQCLMEQLNGDETVNIVNMGAGTGATTAAIVLAMETALGGNAKIASSRISITDIEGTGSFFSQLKDFSPAVAKRLAVAGLNFDVDVQDGAEKDFGVSPAAYKVMYGDILSIFQSLEFETQKKNDVTIITANYVWHRLPTVVKAEIIRHAKEKFPNVIFLVGDLVRNTSDVNLRYFNGGYNGPLNCGNLKLDKEFERLGFGFETLGQNQMPLNTPRAIAEKFRSIEPELMEDKFVSAAFHGAKAEELMIRGRGNSWYYQMQMRQSAA